MARTLAEAREECRARALGVSACVELVDPFCGPNENAVADIDVDGGLAFCRAQSSLSPRQAAVLVKEAQARQAASSGPPWVLIAAAVGASAVLVWLVTRN